MRVKLRHLIEQVLLGRRGFLHPIEVLKVTLGVLDRRGRVGRARFLVTGDDSRRVQLRQPLQVRDPILASAGSASFSRKIKVDVIGSKPSASPKAHGRSPTIAFPGPVKTFTLSLPEAARMVARVASFSPFVLSLWNLLSTFKRMIVQPKIARSAMTNPL